MRALDHHTVRRWERQARRFFHPTPPRYILARLTARRKFATECVMQDQDGFTEEDKLSTTVLVIDSAEQTDDVLAIRIPFAQVADLFPYVPPRTDEVTSLVARDIDYFHSAMNQKFVTWKLKGCIKNASGQWHRAGGTGVGVDAQFVTFASREHAEACEGHVLMFDFNNHKETVILEQAREAELEAISAKALAEKAREAQLEAISAKKEAVYQWILDTSE